MKPTKKSDAFAEIVESSLSCFLAQSWQWDHFPTFGALLQAEGNSSVVLGVVTNIQTGSMDPTRYPFPYQKTEEELQAEQPQIFELLKTTFRVQLIGYMDEVKIFYVLPPKPCKIHSFVCESNKEIVSKFFSKPDFLHLLFAFENQIPNLDELLLAIFKQLTSYKILDEEKLDNFCKFFSLLSGNDYRRLKLFLGRAQMIIRKN